MRDRLVDKDLPVVRYDPPLPFPFGATWSMISLRQMDHLVLPVAGRRSIYATWPPGSFCEVCGIIVDQGYVGSVPGDRVHFPSAKLHRTCEACVRQELRLEASELTGHVCVERCTDRLHLELVDIAGMPLPVAKLPDRHPQLLSLQARGWRVVDVTPPPRLLADVAPTHLAIWIEPVRPLPWVRSPPEEVDPWVW